jgi:putative ABC transport system permease protein
MLRNYIKIALRIITRQKLFSIINVFGLSIGIASSLLILSYVYHEISYDTYHEKVDRIARINMSLAIDGETKIIAVSPNIAGPILAERAPEVENYVRLYNMCFRTNAQVKVNDEDFSEKNVYLADSTFSDIFDLELIHGSTAKLLTEPNDLLLSEKTAKKYFGSKPALSQSLQINGKDFIIKGIYKDFPSNSHFIPDMIGSYYSDETSKKLRWQNASFFTFLLLNENTSLNELEKKMNAIAQEELPDFYKAVDCKFYIEPLKDIYLYSDADMGLSKSGDIKIVYAFSAIAIFIIIIACFNYMNLASARSMDRSRETGMRKVLGANRGQLIIQYMGESFVITMISLLIAVALVELVKPYYYQLIGQSININIITNWKIWGLLIVSGIVISILSGLYPSLVLSSYKPTTTLKGKATGNNKGSGFRKGLVILQFSISTFMIIGTLVVYKQLMFMQNAELGFQKDQVLVLTVSDHGLRENFNAFKSSIINHNNILDASSAHSFPGRRASGTTAKTENMLEGEELSIWNVRADEGYVNTLGIAIIHGRDLLKEDGEVEERRFLINESAANLFGWDPESSVGNRAIVDDSKGVCIGVMKDYNFSSMREKIEPLVIFYGQRKFNSFFLVKMGAGDIGSTISFMEQEWNKIANDQPFDYFFLDEDFDRLYKSERKAGQILLIFAVFTIIIACLGLFGLSSYMAIQRTKEIGVRKVMGSTSFALTFLMIKDNLKFILISFLISMPAGFLIMKNWLLDFAYRINIGLDIPLLSIFLVGTIAVLTVSYFALKAAFANPVDSLRYE